MAAAIYFPHLTGDVQATAVDISPQMLANSQALNPDVEHHVGDMRSVRLGRRFQAVLIHDAISYMLTEEDLSATFSHGPCTLAAWWNSHHRA